MMVLSGMSTIDQMKENLDFMKDFRPLDEKETQAVEKVCEIIRGKKLISCTECRYCVDGCPKKILIPDLFDCMNAKRCIRTGILTITMKSTRMGMERHPTASNAEM